MTQLTDYDRQDRSSDLAPFAGRRDAGFTLIELLIVVAVIAILAAIAYPSYDNHVLKTRRNAAAACAMEGAQWMERFYTTNLAYDKDQGGTAVSLPQGGCTQDLVAHYTFQLSKANAVTPTSYVVEAVPIGNQLAKDTKCATLSINQTGEKKVSNSSTAVKDCW